MGEGSFENFRSPEEEQAAKEFSAESDQQPTVEMNEEVERAPVERGRSFIEKARHVATESLKTYFTLPDDQAIGSKVSHVLSRTLAPAWAAAMVKLAVDPAPSSAVHTMPGPAYMALGSLALGGAFLTAHSLYESYQTRQRNKERQERRNQNG